MLNVKGKKILTKEIIAAKSKILTKRSSNCSRIKVQIDFPIKKIK